MENLPSNPQRTNLPQFSLASTNQIAKAIQGFGEDYSRLVLCKYFKPCGIKSAVEQKAPTFHDISAFFGEDAMRFWLRLHIAETFAFLGIYDTASKYQVQQTADLIMQHEIYGQLTLSEFLCFLQRFKMGSYGKIYQSSRPNPQEFLMCLRPFWNELCQERGKADEKERQKQLSEMMHDPNNLTREEYLIIKQIEQEYDIFVEFNRGKYG